MIQKWIYYTLSTIIYIFVLYIVYKMNVPQEKNTYVIITPEGKVLEGSRRKYIANLLLTKWKQNLLRDDLIIKQVKFYNKDGRKKE
jgi:hypothetical protein